MENSLTIFSQLPSTKTEQKSFVQQMIDVVLDGERDPLQIEAKMKSLEDIVKEYRKNPDIRNLLLEEVRKYPKGVADVYNATFQEKETGVKYDFSQCGYKAYDELCAKIDELNEQKKLMEEEMKLHMKAPWSKLDEESGEVYEINPPFRTATSQVVVTLNK